MTTSMMINSASFWANQLSAMSARRTSQSIAAASSGSNAAGTSAISDGGGLFADLVSSLSGAAVTANGTGAATAATATTTTSAAASAAAAGSPVSRSQIAQDLQAFTQSLSAALASNQAAPAQGSSAVGSALGSVVPHAHRHGHGYGGIGSRLESLINSLNVGSSNAAAGTTSASTNPAIASLDSSYSKLMTDLGGAANATSTQGSGATLQALLQDMLQHEQQQQSWGTSICHVLHAVA
jgi:hypothetical protein